MKRWFIPAAILLFISGCAHAQGTTSCITCPTNTPTVSLSPASIAFGNQQNGIPSSSQTATLQNTGLGNLNVTNIANVGGNTADFTWMDTCGGQTSFNTLPGVSCTFAIVFTPGGLGARSTTFTMTDNASGSPHTIALSGTGISTGNCGGFSTICGPSSYTAPSTVSDPSCGSPPCAIVDPAPAPPPESNPSSINIQTDNNFVHSSSGGISGTNKTAYWRCTGPGVFGGFYAAVTGNAANSSYRVPSGSSEPGFSLLKTQISITSDAGNKAILLPVNTALGWCDGANMIVPNFPAIINGVVQGVNNPAINYGGGSPHASLSVDKLWYGYSCALTEATPGIAEYNTSTNPATCALIVADINTTCGLAAGTIPTGGGNWLSSLDTTGGPYSVGAGKDTVLASYKGPQNAAHWAVAIQRTGANGTSPGCKWYRGDTDVAGTNNWLGSTSASCTNCLGFNTNPSPPGGFHAVELSMDGKSIEIAFQQGCVLPCNAVQHVVFWTMASNTFTDATNVAGSGHRAWGFNQMMVLPSPGGVQGVKETSPNTVIQFGQKLGAVDQHNTCASDNANDDFFEGTDSYVGISSQGSCVDPSVPGQNEIMAVRTDQACAGASPPAYCTDGSTALTHRFMKNHANGCAAANPPNGGPGYFYYTPRGNESRDGSSFFFNSNWNEGLGLSGNIPPQCPVTLQRDCNCSLNYGTCKRVDVFFVELR